MRRAHQGAWAPPADRADPVALLDAQNRNRLPELVPVRWARMVASPFAFLRGAAAVMAADLAPTPVTGITVQLGGDAHLANFGVFASPERDLLFDVTDFDETHRGPWEWDIKRLTASSVVAARDAGLGEGAARTAAEAAARAYRRSMRRFAAATVLDTWYARIDEEAARLLRRGRSRAKLEQLFDAARRQTSATALPQLADLTRAGTWRIVDHPPVVSHVGMAAHEPGLRTLMETYRHSLEDDRRLLLDQFTVRDFALKVVGVGSVGTRCFVALLESNVGEPLFLQVKEAEESVLAPYTPSQGNIREGRRVVAGQRIMQADSDIFLGWAEGDGVDYYIRQLRDMKGSADFATMGPDVLRDFVTLCGESLARAHARSGAAPEIDGYLGRSRRFDQALTEFAVAYADQTVRDHQALRDAVRAGRIDIKAPTASR